MTENRVDALLDGKHDAEDKAIAKLTVLDKDTTGAESRAAEVVAEKALLGRFRYNPGLGWMEWDGRRWDGDDVVEPRVIEAVRQCADALERDYRVCSTVTVTELEAVQAAVLARLAPEQRVGRRGGARTPDQLVEEHATAEERARRDRALETEPGALAQAEIWLNLLTSGKINALVKLCRGMDGIVTRAAEFDAHPDLLNCHNGVVDLRTGELLPHDPDLLITRLAGGGYNSGARSMLWDKALNAVPPDLREWLQNRMGQSATGHTPDDDCLIVSDGGGENGKTAVTLAILRALGSYGQVISHRVLTASPDAHPTELMDLRGLRLAVLEETPEEGRLDTHRVKTTIGTPFITARKMRKDDVTFATSHTLWVNTNHLPQVDSTDHGTWRRLKAMPWPYRFLKPDQETQDDNDRPGDLTLKPKLATNPTVPAAVIAWLVEGAKRWYAAERISPPDPQLVADATKQWRARCDVGYQFATERLETDPTSYITRAAFHSAFLDFLTQEGKREWSSQKINSRLPSSLAEAGIRLTATPLEAAKIREGDRQSLSTGVYATSNEPAAGTTMRMWRGVRFKPETKAEMADGGPAAKAAEGATVHSFRQRGSSA